MKIRRIVEIFITLALLALLCGIAVSRILGGCGGILAH